MAFGEKYEVDNGIYILYGPEERAFREPKDVVSSTYRLMWNLKNTGKVKDFREIKSVAYADVDSKLYCIIKTNNNQKFVFNLSNVYTPIPSTLNGKKFDVSPDDHVINTTVNDPNAEQEIRDFISNPPSEDDNSYSPEAMETEASPNQMSNPDNSFHDKVEEEKKTLLEQMKEKNEDNTVSSEDVENMLDEEKNTDEEDKDPEEEEDMKEQRDEVIDKFEEDIKDKMEDAGLEIDDEEEGKGEGYFVQTNIFSDNKPMYNTEEMKELNKEIKANKKDLNRRLREGSISKEEYRKLMGENKEHESYLYFRNMDKFKWEKNTLYICFVSGDSLFSESIKMFTNSKISHVDLFYNGWCYSSIGHGVNKFKMPKNVNFIPFKFNPVKVDPRKVLKFFKMTDGRGYGADQIVQGIFLHIDTGSDKERYFCSQWVSEALDRASDGKIKIQGKPLGAIGYSLITPVDLLRGLLMERNVIKPVE